jgi:putative SOS response-associated peptidase YedK
MCYSSQIIAEWKKYRRQYSVEISVRDYFDLFWRRGQGDKVKIPKGMEDSFSEPESDAERDITTLVDKWRAAETLRLEQELFKQRRRLADADRALATKPTMKAAEDNRIAASKVTQILAWLANIQRDVPKPRDSRIFPSHYCHVIVSENGQRVLKPMRYGCRPAGKPAFYDTKYPGTYNARRDNLEGFWKGQFGYHHGIMVATCFYENVDRDGKNVVLEFRPNSAQQMLVACLWSRWTAPGEPDLLSFAAITDEPPPEVAAAGHDRCIVPIRPENIDAWLNPESANLLRVTKLMTTNNVLERYPISGLIGGRLHGQEDGRGDAQAGAGWANAAGRQDARADRSSGWRGTPDRVHVEGPAGGRRHRCVTRHVAGASCPAGCAATGGLAPRAVATAYRAWFWNRVVDAQAGACAHRAFVRGVLQ